MTRSSPRVLVVEDEYFIGDEIARALACHGIQVIGPVPTLDEALAVLAAGDRIDVAILDINLRGKMVYPVADALVVRGIPFVFATGYDNAFVRPEHRHVPVWRKPYDATALARFCLAASATGLASQGKPGERLVGWDDKGPVFQAKRDSDEES